MQPLVSVIVPAYNAQQSVKKCIKSIQEQTYQNLEIICINDGSKDDTASILDELAKIDSRIKVIHNQNQGVSATRNCGIENATGEYIQFVDSDDALYSTITEKLVIEMEQTSVDLVFFGYHRTDNVDVRVPFTGMYTIREMGKRFPDIYNGGVFNQPWNKLYKKSLITTGFDSEMSIAEDAVFNANYLKHVSRVSFIDEIGYEYVIDSENSLSRKYNKTAFESEKKKIVEIKNLLHLFEAEESVLSLDKEFENDFLRCALSMIYASDKTRKELEKDIYKWVTDEVWLQVLLHNRNLDVLDEKKAKKQIGHFVLDRFSRRCMLRMIEKVKGK